MLLKGSSVWVPLRPTQSKYAPQDVMENAREVPNSRIPLCLAFHWQEERQSHRTAKAGRGLWVRLLQTCSSRNPQSSWGGFSSTVPVFQHPHSAGILPGSQRKPPVFQFVLPASCLSPGTTGKSPALASLHLQGFTYTGEIPKSSFLQAGGLCQQQTATAADVLTSLRWDQETANQMLQLILCCYSSIPTSTPPATRVERRKASLVSSIHSASSVTTISRSPISKSQSANRTSTYKGRRTC